jgi:hypothetical protein
MLLSMTAPLTDNVRTDHARRVPEKAGVQESLNLQGFMQEERGVSGKKDSARSWGAVWMRA